MPLDTQLAQLETAQLVRHLVGDDSTYIFKHVLTQEASYSSLLLRDRKHLHFMVAQVLEQQYANHIDKIAAQLASHLLQAEEFDASFKYYILAGDAAARVYANAEAHLQYEQALKTQKKLPRSDISIRHQMDALIKCVSVSTIIDTPENNLARLVQAEAFSGRVTEWQPSDEEHLAQIYFWRGFLNMLRGELELSNTAYQRTIELASECNDSQLVANASFDMGINLNFQGQFGRSATQMANAIHLLEQSGKPLEEINALAHLGYALVAQGNHAEGIAKIELGLAHAQARQNPFGIATCLTVLALAYQMENQVPKMLEATRTVIQIAEKFGATFWILAGHTLQAWATSRLGKHDAAFAQLAKAQTLSRQFNMPLFGGGMLNAIQSEIKFNAGHWDEALIAAEKTISLVQPVGGILAQGIAHRVWGQALVALDPSHWSDAQQHLGTSLELFQMGDANLEAARTHVTWGKLLSEHGDDGAAREHFYQATDQFQKFGLTSERDKTRTLLSMGKS